MSRLIIVSNRVGDLDNPAQSGGLAVALADALRRRGGVWFGWNGEIVTQPVKDRPVPHRTGEVERIGVPLSRQEFADYYIGYANSVLWPLFHYRLDLIDYRPPFLRNYRKVNQRFALELSPFVKARDLIWVHDYHLIPLARQMRRLGASNPIGFFLHIPFPPPEILAAAPNHVEIVEALLDYDVIGFQTSTDLVNFRRYVEDNVAGAALTSEGVTFKGRLVRTRRFPIGIDVDIFAEMADRPNEDVRIEQMRRHMLQRKQVIGVDRLDYSKGLPSRFQAFEKLLVDNPQLERKVSFLQIAPPTRETIDAYSMIRGETEGLAGAINGRFAEFDWTPIRYIHRSVGRDKLASLYRMSDVGFVTPLRDGMNLVAKEFVAAQNPDDPGVLVLSRFAGAAEDMVDAVLVNPHDIDEMSRALQTALTMPLGERVERHRALLARVRETDVSVWAASFLDALARTEERPATRRRPPRRIAPPPPAAGTVGPGGLGYLMTLSPREEETVGVGREDHKLPKPRKKPTVPASPDGPGTTGSA
ncbi:MAG: trehalose-6-phosphate synthase [Rhizobiaceae bacterium]